MPDDFTDQISTLGEHTDEIVEKVLKAGGKVVLAKVSGNLQSVIGRTKYPSRATGKLAESLGLSPAKVNRSGDHDVKVGFSESRRDGKVNAKLAAILEYGKHGQPPRPFLKPAKSAAKSECIETMKSTLEAEIKKI